MISGGGLARFFPQGLRGIVFDCDGVMIDSAAANRHLYNLIMQSLGLPSLTREQEIFAFQATFLDAIHALVPKNLHDRIDDICHAQINYDRDILPLIKIMPGYREFLAKAHASGLKLAIDTNRTEQGAHKVLDFLGLPNYFDPIMSCTKVEPKPSPMGARLIANAWNVAPAQCLFIGDSRDDGAAAHAAGMVFGGFGLVKGDFQIESWRRLEEQIWPYAAGA